MLNSTQFHTNGYYFKLYIKYHTYYIWTNVYIVGKHIYI